MSAVGRAKISNFERALLRLEDAIKQPDKNVLEIDGVLKRFEFCFAVCWKTLKYVLEEEGNTDIITTPGATFRQAVTQGLLQNREIWEQMLKDRNLLAHVYDETQARLIAARVADYCDAMRYAHRRLIALYKDKFDDSGAP